MSRFGSLSWQADLPPGSSISFETRTGNVGEPDETWSPWTASQIEKSAGATASPPARFVQYRAKLSTTDPRQNTRATFGLFEYRTSNLSRKSPGLTFPT